MHKRFCKSRKRLQTVRSLKAGRTSSISTYAIKLGIRFSGTTKTAFRRRFVGEVILRRLWLLSHAEMSDSFVE